MGKFGWDQVKSHMREKGCTHMRKAEMFSHIWGNLSLYVALHRIPQRCPSFLKQCKNMPLFTDGKIVSY